MSAITELVFRLSVQGADQVRRQLEQVRAAAVAAGHAGATAPASGDDRLARLSALASGGNVLPPLPPPGYRYGPGLHTLIGPNPVTGAGMGFVSRSAVQWGPPVGPLPPPAPGSIAEAAALEGLRLAQQQAARAFRRDPNELTLLGRLQAEQEIRDFQARQAETRRQAREAERTRLGDESLRLAQEVYGGAATGLHPLAAARRLAVGADELQRRGGAANENLAAAMRSLEQEIRTSFRETSRQAAMNPLDRANLASWRFGLTALTLQFGGIPLVQAQQAIQQQGRPLLPPDYGRTTLSLERLGLLGRLAAQGEPQQQAIEGLGNQALRVAANLGLGGALPYAAAGLQAAIAGANLASVVVMLTALNPTVSANTTATAANTTALSALTAAIRGTAAVAPGGGAIPIPAPGAPPGLVTTGPGGAPTGGLAPLRGPAVPVNPTVPVGGGLSGLPGWLALIPFIGSAIDVFTNRAPGPYSGLYPQIRSEDLLPERVRARERARAGLITEHPEIAPDATAVAIAAARIGAIRSSQDPQTAAIVHRLQVEEIRRQTDPLGYAADQERLGDLQAALGFAQRRRSLFEGQEDDRRQYERLLANQAFERGRLDVQQGRTVAEIGLQSRRQETAILRARVRQGRDIERRYQDQLEDISLQYGAVGGPLGGDALADIERSYGRTVRDIRQSSTESRQDIERGFQRGIRNTILSQALGGGLAGALIQQALARRDALEDVEIREGRALARAGVGRGDALADAELARDRAVRGAGIARRRGLRDADTARDDALEDNALATGQAYEDAGRRYVQSIEDLITAQQRERDFLKEEQELREKRRTQALADLAFEEQMRARRQQGIREEIQALEDYVKKAKEINKELENALQDAKQVARIWGDSGT